MRLNYLQIEDANNGDEQIVMALRKMMKKELEVMVIHAVQQVIEPIMVDVVRKVVKEEIQLVQEKFLTCQNQNSLDETTTSRTRSLKLKFLDEVSGQVLTGKEIEGRKGTHIRIALVDSLTEIVVESGPEASAKVELLVLDAGHDNNSHRWNLEDFYNSIIRECDKKKPHFSKTVHLYLEKGIGVLCNVRLGHDSHWMKSCRCRLGARVVDTFGGSRVKEAWTESFMVLDSRSKLYGKHYPPSLSDPIWRLDNIGRDGAPCKRLHEGNVKTVQEFLFLLTIDPQRLQKLLSAGAKTWKAIVDHARTCKINDTRILLYWSSSESKTGVVFDIVGQLKGVLRDYHFVPIGSVYEVEKAEAQKLLASAFENWKDVASFNDETSFVHEFPCISSDNSATNSSRLDVPDGHNYSIVGNIDGCDRRLPEYSYEPSFISPGDSPSFPLSDLGPLLETLSDTEDPISLIYSNNEDISETHGVESHSDQQRTSGSIRLVGTVAIITVRWLFRVRKRATSSGDSQAQKRQRHH